MALITPRSITPRSGVRMRTTRLRSTSRCGQSPRAIKKSLLRGLVRGNCFQKGASLHTLCRPVDAEEGSRDGSDTASATGHRLMPREDPRRLFVRDPLPCTQALSATQVSPSAQQRVERDAAARHVRPTTPSAGMGQDGSLPHHEPAPDMSRSAQDGSERRSQGRQLADDQVNDPAFRRVAVMSNDIGDLAGIFQCRLRSCSQGLINRSSAYSRR